MSTLSTLTTLPPAPPPPSPPPTPPSSTQTSGTPANATAITDLWPKYFAGQHADVLNQAAQFLFAARGPDFLHICGLSLFATGRVADAVVMLKTALLLFHSAPSWFANASIAALNAGAVNESLEFAVAGLQRHNDPMLHFCHGNALMHLNRLDEAQSPFIQAFTLKPDMQDARLNLGNVLRRSNRPEEALAFYNQVLNKEPTNTLAMINRAGALIELNHHDEAAMILMRLMAISEIPEVSFMMAMLRLKEGDFSTGFDLYRSRFDCAMAAPDKAQFRKPVITSLAEATNKHVLLSHEQGFGDTLQFIRYLPMLVEKVRHVTLMVPAALHRLLKPMTSSLGVTVVSNRDEAMSAHHFVDYDLECPMLHLPYLFGTTLETIPATVPYLALPPEIVKQQPLPKRHMHTHKRVGLVWAGQMRANADLAAVDRRRSLSYRQFEPLLDLASIDFVSLQTGDPAKQILETGTKGWRRPYDVTNDAMDFCDTAALVSQLDLVITVDTAMAHLAGALGTPVWVLSRFDQCWRWLKDRDDSPWYPGVLRLLHQQARGDWDSVLVKLKRELEIWAAA